MYDPDSFENFANRSSSKWLRYPEEVLPMHVAEMDFEVAAPIRNKLVEMVQNSDLGYLGPFPKAGEAFQAFALQRWGWDLDPSGLKMATDVGVAAVEILKASTGPGEKVLINSPVYAAFFSWLAEADCVPVDAPLQLVDGNWTLDLAAIRREFENGVKVFLLCSPQNPVGRIHSAKELTEIAKLAHEFDVLVIADEIHAPLSWGVFTPYLSVSQEARETGVTISSSSKAWNTAGLKAGFLVTASESVRKKLSSLPDAMQWRSSILGAHAMVMAFQEGTPWLDETVHRLQENLEYLRLEVADKLPAAEMFEMEATYLAWIDLGAYRIQDLQQAILREAKVAVVAGSDHGISDEYPGFIRFNFATSKARITEAVNRIAKLCEGN